MISIKNYRAQENMREAARRLREIFDLLEQEIALGVSTEQLDRFIAQALSMRGLISATKGYMGYQHVSCISRNDEVVHGVPSRESILKMGDLVKIDICASYNGYCADMARQFTVGPVAEIVKDIIHVAQQALDIGIAQAVVGNHISDISAAIQAEVERHGFGVVRDFAGHGIGKKMHEEPEILNYGKPGKGQKIKEGMTFAIEPMITAGHYEVYIAKDGWTVKTCDGSLAAHVEDTVLVTPVGPVILTRS